VIGATAGPQMDFCTAALFAPYSMAWRTSPLPIAPPVSGLRRLNTMYGNVVDQGQILKLGLPPVSRPGSDDGFSGVSLVMSSLPACMSESCVCADVTPSVSTILST